MRIFNNLIFLILLGISINSQLVKAQCLETEYDTKTKKMTFYTCNNVTIGIPNHLFSGVSSGWIDPDKPVTVVGGVVEKVTPGYVEITWNKNFTSGSITLTIIPPNQSDPPKQVTIPVYKAAVDIITASTTAVGNTLQESGTCDLQATIKYKNGLNPRQHCLDGTNTWAIYQAVEGGAKIADVTTPFSPKNYWEDITDKVERNENNAFNVRLQVTNNLCGVNTSDDVIVTITPEPFIVPNEIYSDTTTCSGVGDGRLTINSLSLSGHSYGINDPLPYGGAHITIMKPGNNGKNDPIGNLPNGITINKLSDLNDPSQPYYDKLNLPADTYYFTVERLINNEPSSITDKLQHVLTITDGPKLSLNIPTSEPTCYNKTLTSVNATVLANSTTNVSSDYNFFGATGSVSGNSFNYNLSNPNEYSLYAQHSTVSECQTGIVSFINPAPISISKNKDDIQPGFCYDTDRITNTEFGNIYVKASDYNTSTLSYTITQDGALYTPDNQSINGDVTTFKVAPGSYVITATDNCNITSNQVTANINSLAKPIVSIDDISIKNPDCPNSQGSITLSQFSYNGTPYTSTSTLDNFTFYNGVSTSQLNEVANKPDFFNFTTTPTSSTKYYFKIEYTDTRCPILYDRDLIYRSKVILNTPEPKESCLDNNNGTITISSSEGNTASDLRTYTISPAHSPTNTFNISDGSPAFFTDLHPGVNYTITVDDHCTNGSNTATASETIGSFNRPSATFIATQIECHNDSTGTLTVTPNNASGSTPSYDITLLPNDVLYLNVTDGDYRIFEGLNHTDNYSVRIKDSNGCVETFEDEIPEIINPQQLKFITVPSDITDVTCWDGNDGAILASVGGGTGQIDFSIDGGSFNQGTDDGLSYIYNFQGLREGVYNIAVQDIFGCTTNSSYTITQPDEYFVNTLSPTGALCFGGSDGSLSVSAIGGSPDGSNYTYNLMDENNNQVDSLTGSAANFPGLEFGDYYVNILDSRNCPLNSETVSISQPEEMTITPLKTSASCFDSDSITLTARVKGGTEPYTFQWKDLNDNGFGENDSTVKVYTGTYFVSITDENNCAYGRTATNLTPIPFRFDATRPDTLEITIDNQIDVDYNGLSNGSVSLGSTGGWSFHQYSLDGINFQDSSIFSNLGIGDYTFYVKDRSNCSNSITTTITEPAPFTVSLNNNETQDVNCFNGSDGQITINAEGGRPPYSFTLDNGEGNIITQSSNVFENLPAGNYKIDVGYNTYTETINNIFISQPGSALTSVIDNYQQPKCTFADGWATVNASGGTGPYSYTWNNQQVTSTATNLSSGDYFVEVTDGNNCIDTAFLTLYDIEGPELNVTQINDLPCFDSDNVGSITLNVTGGNEPYNIQWDDSNNQTGLTASNLGAGNYSATVTDDDGCISILEDLIITRPEELSATLTYFKDPACYNDANGEITVAGNGGTAPYQFQWQNMEGNPTTATVTGLAAGTYEVLITDDHNCTATASNTLMNPEEIIITLPDSVFICQGQTATLDAGNMGALFEWVADNGFTSDQQIINVQDQGDYLVKVSNVEGCSNTAKTYLKFENRDFYATFLMSGEATMNDTIVVIELSKPQPDEIEWFIPEDFRKHVDGDSYKELIPVQTGDFTIGMKAGLSGCSELVEKRITIVPADNSTKEKSVADALIQTARLFPNPNTGQFEVEVKLAREADISADVFSMKGMRMMPTKYDYGKKDYLLDFNMMQLSPGIYFVNIMVEKEIRKLKFIVN